MIILDYYDGAIIEGTKELKKADELVDPSLPSIFLAGPTARKIEEHKKFGWRDNFVEIAKLIPNFDCIIHIPEFHIFDQNKFKEYSDFPDWEIAKIESCDVLAFWVPRRENEMQGYTTNVEFGSATVQFPEKILYGRPNTAVRTRYLDYIYDRRCNRVPATTLAGLVMDVSYMAKDLKNGNISNG